MKFTIDTPVRLLEVKNIVSKAGNAMTFVRFANMKTFETLELKLTALEGQTSSDFVEGHDYMAVVSYDGQYGGVTLTSVVPAKTSGFTTAKN